MDHPIVPRSHGRWSWLTRPSSRTLDLLTVIGLLGVLGATSLTAPYWAELLRADAPVEEGGGSEPTPEEQQGSEEEARRTISVRLYFEAPTWTGLVPEQRDVSFASDLNNQVRIVMEELAAGSKTDLVSTLGADTRIRAVLVSPRGIAYVSLSMEAAAATAGSREELHSVYAIVNTVAANFPAVRRVQILLEDREAETFAGHVDISHALLPDMTLVAPPPSPWPEPADEAKGAPAPSAAP